mmetsp:Transcript_6689/g.16831  ORF Transcript_6689/g.16831 Transcript_6689/m.16831 type:complete len:214 (+) Transcript_6689:305-946(+)
MTSSSSSTASFSSSSDILFLLFHRFRWENPLLFFFLFLAPRQAPALFFKFRRIKLSLLVACFFLSVVPDTLRSCCVVSCVHAFAVVDDEDDDECWFISFNRSIDRPASVQDVAKLPVSVLLVEARDEVALGGGRTFELSTGSGTLACKAVVELEEEEDFSSMLLSSKASFMDAPLGGRVNDFGPRVVSAVLGLIRPVLKVELLLPRIRLLSRD